MRKPVVIFDVDDVLIPLASEIHKAIGRAGLNPENKPMTQWEMYLDYGCTKEQWIDVFSSLAVPNGIYHAPPYPGVRAAMNMLENHGAEIHLVTARGFHNHSDKIRRWTHEWKAEWHIPGTLHFSNTKGVTALQLGATHAVDDALHNVKAMESAGTKTWLMNRDHNQKDTWPRRVHDTYEFALAVLDG